jgi:MoaA/NifB/PqqE/SkfB family radical SAM enzyme/SAM-dependent methyltransferase
MAYNPTLWNRLEYEGTPIYVRYDKPSWFVPNGAGDQILRSVSPNMQFPGTLTVQRFLDRLTDGEPYDYPGRAALLETEYLREVWFHITNRCNMRCTHCLFASSPDEETELSPGYVFHVADEAHELGCRVFALTGGEPFVHPAFTSIINKLLLYPDTHVVVLTNGMNIQRQLKDQQWDFDRFHLQISLDGLRENHDRTRGSGAFDKLSSTLHELTSAIIPFTLSMCVDSKNVTDMPGLVDFAADVGAGNIHFMWYFVRGRGDAAGFVPPDRIFKSLIQADARAEMRGINIDNLEALKTQVFAPSGTIHDGTTAGWESVAIGPDEKLYPSAALVGIEKLATQMNDGLASAWRNSRVLTEIRKTTAAELTSPLRFILGGGDTDHSCIHAGSFIGDDPYMPLYEQIALWLISREAARQSDHNGTPRIRLKMGDILESCGAHGSIALVHSNCLLALTQKDSLTVVKEFYSDAVGDTNEDILNPVCYPDELINHIPEEFRFRGYGCGSPVVDADITEGERILDLGCGSGVECFIASRLTGRTGQVIGLDMLNPMLELAQQGSTIVSRNLGYRNIEFRTGYLEHIPLDDESVDVVLSNCVMNLSVDKRRAYGEIFRVLRAGGRLVISDVVCETEPDAAIRNDEVLRGECIAGALTQRDLVGILEESGFRSITLLKRFPYRTVQGHPFFSLTYEARKPLRSDRVKVIYRGPLSSAVTSEGMALTPGIIQEISHHEAEILGEQVFVLDDVGGVTNIELENTCACFVAPEETSMARPEVHIDQQPPVAKGDTIKQRSGCMVCGAPLTYLSEEKQIRCAYCKKMLTANAVCENGHFVCDACHSQDALEVIEHICLETSETDMLTLLQQIREHPAVPVHGPEHHALVPGIILAAYKNLGGAISPSTIQTGIQRGSQVAGGYCAFMGICGAAVGVGIAFGLILDANPLKPEERKVVQSATKEVLGEIAALRAARCCQRDSWIALKKAAELSQIFLPIPLRAEASLVCRQQAKNAECMGADCPLLKARLS